MNTLLIARLWWVIAVTAVVLSCSPEVSPRSEKLVVRSSLQLFAECVRRLREEGHKNIESIEQIFEAGAEGPVAISEFYSRGSQWYFKDATGAKYDYIVYRSKKDDPEAIFIATPKAIQLESGKTVYLALRYDLSIVEMEPIQFHEQILNQTGRLDGRDD